MFTEIFTLIGQIVILILIIIIIAFIITICLGKIFINKDILILPKLQIFLLDIFYSPMKKLAKLLKLDDTLIDKISIQTRNKLNYKKFKSIPPEDKLIFLPHCLRNKDCPGKLEYTGVNCIECNKCAIGIIKKEAEPLGYKIFIVPGSSFAKKIIKENKFKAVLGVACHEDLSQSMMLISDFYPQGVLLKKTGCYETKVNVKEVLEKL